MKRIAILLVAVACLAAPVVAHHSFAMFEMDRDVKYTGTVTEVRWQNPHIHFGLRVDPGSGIDAATVGAWDIEAAAIAIMSRQGWTRTTLKPGDKVSVVGHPLRSGEKGMSLFYLIRADGTNLYTDIARPKKPGAPPAP